jgi:hypothetical protein
MQSRPHSFSASLPPPPLALSLSCRRAHVSAAQTTSSSTPSHPLVFSSFLSERSESRAQKQTVRRSTARAPLSAGAWRLQLAPVAIYKPRALDVASSRPSVQSFFIPVIVPVPLSSSSSPPQPLQSPVYFVACQSSCPLQAAAARACNHTASRKLCRGNKNECPPVFLLLLLSMSLNLVLILKYSV